MIEFIALIVHKCRLYSIPEELVLIHVSDFQRCRVICCFVTKRLWIGMRRRKNRMSNSFPYLFNLTSIKLLKVLKLQTSDLRTIQTYEHISLEHYIEIIIRYGHIGPGHFSKIVVKNRNQIFMKFYSFCHVFETKRKPKTGCNLYLKFFSVHVSMY